MAKTSSKRNNGYVARSGGSGMNKSSGNKGKRTKKPLGFDLSDAESRIAFWAFVIVSVLVLSLLVAGFALGISRCAGAGDSDMEAAEQEAEEIVSYADLYEEVSFADIISDGDIG